MRIALSNEQHRCVRIIESEAERIGLGWLFECAVVNAYAESLLDPKAVGDGGKSVGLFQLHEKGAGRGMTAEERRDPLLNTRRIFEVVQGPQGARLRAMIGAPLGDLVAEFAHSIERCAACGHQGGDSELIRRRALAESLFGPQGVA